MSHANIDWDPNQQIMLRYRLFARAIRVKGLSQLEVLYPYLQAKLDEVVTREIEPQVVTDGNQRLCRYPLIPQLMLLKGGAPFKLRL